MLVGVLWPPVCTGQYYYPPPQPGHYPPPYQQPYYYPPQQQPAQRQQPAQQRRSAPKDLSKGTPPAADLSDITDPFGSYTWDYADTLADLAKATGTTPNQLLALNHLSMSQLRDGQVLKIPETSNTASLDIKLDPLAQRNREVWRGIRGKKRIALTFDAGGETDGFEMLLDNLKSREAAATFFVTGQFSKDNPEMVRAMADEGYPVHNHSWSHPDFTTISNVEIASELSRTDEEVQKVTGLSTKPFWRPPFGDRDERVLKSAAENGYQSIYWTLDSLDSVGDPKDAAFVRNRILSPPNARANPDNYLDGAIVLMHVGMPETARAIPELVDQLRERGFTLVTVEEILQP